MLHFIFQNIDLYRDIFNLDCCEVNLIDLLIFITNIQEIYMDNLVFVQY